MTTLYQNLLNLQSNTGGGLVAPATKTPTTASTESSSSSNGGGVRRSSVSLPVSTCAHYIGKLTMLERKKKQQKKTVKFPTGILMQQAIMDGDVQEVKQIVAERGGYVAANELEPNGLSPAMRCVFESQLDALRVVVEAGADLSVQDDDGWTVLHVASSLDDIDAAKYVLNQSKHRITNVRNADGERPIDLAESSDMARLLLDADMKTQQSSVDGGENAILAHVQEHHKKNGDCRALDDAMRTGTCYDSLLHLAAEKNYPLLASYVLRYRLGDVEMRNRKGLTALHTAANSNSIDIVLLLVHSGASKHSLTNSYEKASDLTSNALIHSILQEEYL